MFGLIAPNVDREPLITQSVNVSNVHSDRLSYILVVTEHRKLQLCVVNYCGEN